MAENDRCPACGALILTTDRFCPQCGAPLTSEAPGPQVLEKACESPWQPGETPATIGQLRAFCDYNGMPLEKMRFFVGEDYRQPRAFGIYREGDRFVVYKNKADGSRAVRYDGPDEAWAVKELYDKLLDECHKRNIWPGGKPQERAEFEKKLKRRAILTTVAMLVIFAVITFFIFRADKKAHAHDGYYSIDDGYYYCYGDDWYYWYDGSDWMLADGMTYDDEYADYYVGAGYNEGWGVGDFEQSSAWERIQEEHRTTESDYSGWDSGDTDWSSDW